MMSPEKGPAQVRTQSDVWQELFGTVAFLSESVELGIQALSPDNVAEKVVSATTKKRLHVKSLQSLRLSRDNIQVLQEHLKALQAASQQWQKTMMFASKSHEELMEQLESTNRDLQVTTDRLRATEAQQLVAARETEAQRQHILNIESTYRALQATLKQREDELETCQFATEELKGKVEQLSLEADRAKEAQRAAEEEKDRAVAALDGVRGEADKASAATQRHQETVAKLTADNLVFVMNLKKAEADLSEALAEKNMYKLAAEKQRGPWFDEVRSSVEERVRHSMTLAESLQAEIEELKKQHAAQTQDLISQKNDLEEFLSKVRADNETLDKEAASARVALAEADRRVTTAHAAREQAERSMEELSMRNKVLQDQVKSMRQECTERWVSEQAALSKVSGLESGIAQVDQVASQLRAHISQLESSLEAQSGVNRQLMARKEQVEWQLMETLAKVPDSDKPPPPSSQPPTAPIQPAPAQPSQPPASPLRPPLPQPTRGPPSAQAPTTTTTTQSLEGPVIKRLASDYYGSPPPSLPPTSITKPLSPAPSPFPFPFQQAQLTSASTTQNPPAPSPTSTFSTPTRTRQTAEHTNTTSIPPPTTQPAPAPPHPAPLPPTAAPPSDPSCLHPAHPLAAPATTSSNVTQPTATSHTSTLLGEVQKQLQTQTTVFKASTASSLSPSDALFDIRHAPGVRRVGSLSPPTASHPVWSAPLQPVAAPDSTVLQPPLEGAPSLSLGVAASAPQKETPQKEPAAQDVTPKEGPTLAVHPAMHKQAMVASTVPRSPARGSASGSSLATGQMSPIARDPSPAPPIILTGPPLHHPAMHPALLVPASIGAPPAAAVPVDELEMFGGGGPGRRISATSVNTTPPPKAKGAADK